METAQVTRSTGVNAALALAAAAAAGVVGCLGFKWLLDQGFYAVALPGILIGLAGGLVMRKRCLVTAAICGVMALLAGLFSVWHWLVDESLGYFLTHLQDLRPLTLIMILLGVICGFYFALGRNRTSPGRGAGE